MKFLLLILVWFAVVPKFYLGADLKRAKHILSDEHGIEISNEDKRYTLNVFEPYVKIDPTNFKFSARKEGKYTINCWKSNGKQRLEIYQVETKLHVDTAYTIRIDTDPNPKQQIQKTSISADFNYRTYVINDGIKPQLVFTIATKGEQLNYSIGKHSVDPSYESIPVGLQTPDEEEILKLIDH